MNLSLPVIEAISTVWVVLMFVILPLGLMFWLGKKAEPTMPPERSVAGVVGRVVFVAAVFWLYALYANYGAMYWRLRSLERMRDRAHTLEQVKLAGGWEAVTKGCDELMQLPRFYNYSWLMGRSHPSPVELPSALAALKPQVVRFERHSETNWAVSMWLRAGRRDSYGLRVMCAAPTNSATALPPFSSPPGVKPGRQLTDRVYEF